MYKIYTYLVLPTVFLLIGSPIESGLTGVPLSRDNDLENLGLYNSSDKVITLDKDNMELFIMNQRYGTFFEFYNSYCGHCKRFAPKYKQLADEIYSWRKFIKVAALDCADDKNSDVCREYEVMAYPSLRYFSPYYLKPDGEEKFGKRIYKQDIEKIKKMLINQVINETQSSNNLLNFSELTDMSIGNLFSNLSEEVKYVLVIYENDNSTLASGLMLDFSLNDAIQIRRTTNPDIAVRYNIVTLTTIAAVDRNSNIEQLHSEKLEETSFRNTISKFLTEKNLQIQTTTTKNELYHLRQNIVKNNSVIIEYVKTNGLHVVYKADLDYALHYALFHEIPKYSNISGERLSALQNFINVVSRFNPLGKNGEEFMRKLKDFVLSKNQKIDGTDLQNYVKQLEKENSVPLFATTDLWIGCVGSKPILRGFTCGLWKLFHYLTVRAADHEQSTDPLEVLQAIHDYVKNFFGCTDCAKHFQEMSVHRKIWNIASKDDAILWLWSAHNEVNQRLAGDETEDPYFPKQQFPSTHLCNQCYHKDPSTLSELDQIHWNKQEVLQFMKKIYNQQNISYYGLGIENLDNINKSAQISGNIFSDIDISFGFILYGFCIIMMIFAVKLFMHRGYRKKPYPHTILGKV